jgi:hypothetical protein
MADVKLPRVNERETRADYIQEQGVACVAGSAFSPLTIEAWGEWLE